MVLGVSVAAAEPVLAAEAWVDGGLEKRINEINDPNRSCTLKL